MSDYEKLCEDLRSDAEYQITLYGEVAGWRIRKPAKRELQAADAIEEQQELIAFIAAERDKERDLRHKNEDILSAKVEALQAKNERLNEMLAESFQCHLLAENAALTAEIEKLRQTTVTKESVAVLVERNEQLQAENERLKDGVDILNSYIIQLENQKEDMWIEIERLKKQLDLMAHYIVEFGKVDYFLCDNIPQEIHLKHQPKNDGNYDNAPCIECVKEYFATRGEEEKA